MNPIEEIKGKLKKHSQLNVVEDSNSIMVKAATQKGFDVMFEDTEDEYRVYFEGWHEHFEKTEVESALECFAFGLSDSCRIKEYSRRGKPYKWILESKVDGEWESDSTTGLITLNIFGKPDVKYLKNRVIHVPDS